MLVLAPLLPPITFSFTFTVAPLEELTPVAPLYLVLPSLSSYSLTPEASTVPSTFMIVPSLSAVTAVSPSVVVTFPTVCS